MTVADATDPPNISAATRHRIGRTLLPPAIREYFLDFIIVLVFGLVDDREFSRASSTKRRFSPK